jgi:hypothetical protein
MKYISALIILFLLISCQITETIQINPDGSGTIEVVQLRNENSYMQLAGDQYAHEEIFRDTTYVFQEYIKKHNETFLKYTPSEQQLFQKYSNIKVHIKQSSFEKEFRTILSFNFNKMEEVPDLYKTEDYANDIANNYALTAENHYYKIDYVFDGTVFKRTVSITNLDELQKAKDKIKNADPKYASLKLTQTYTLRYHFPKKIKLVSNEKSVISSDKKSITVEFQLLDCLQNPEITSLEVILE